MRGTMSLLPALLLLFVSTTFALDEEDTLLVITGRLLCEGKPSSTVTVSLTDEDRVKNGYAPLGLRSSDKGGNFSVHADISFFDEYIDPTIEIVHKCDRRCIEKSRIRIPWEYALERGARTVDLHIIELSQRFPLAEETSFCTSESDVTWTVPGEKNRG
ncbi:hypothetical protein PRIPAC_96398 [Pristionchus pacificus]|nr:hypothetical protein PRIPAC_96398 [Pristionchus pacificus]